MIKQLRNKFILITMGILIAVFIIILVSLNIVFKDVGNREITDILKEVAASEMLPKKDSDEKGPAHLKALPIYIFKLDENNNIIDMDSTLNTPINEDVIANITRVIDHKKKDGKLNEFEYYKVAKPYGMFIVLMDVSESIEGTFSNRLMNVTIILSSVGLLAIFMVSVYLSRFIVRPVEVAFNKQKQFISDASHELKTPLSTIAVNANIVASDLKDNKHMGYILSEVERMDGLIKQLLDISRIEDTNYKLNKVHFNISEALYSIVLPFESVAYERSVELKLSIQDGIEFEGDLASIKQVFAILIDNAFKYVNEQGLININLSMVKNRIKLEVYNTGEGVSKENLAHLFDRFYRVDSSRAKSEGSYGLGLAIAKGIVEKHNGKINADSKYDEWIRFEVTL